MLNVHRQKLNNKLSAQGDDALRVEGSEEILELAFLDLCESIDSPRSLACWLLFKSGEHEQLLDLDLDPLRYSGAYAFADDALVTKFLSKYPFLDVSFDRQKVAHDAFLEFEEQCRVTNSKFKTLDLDPSQWDPVMSDVFRIARRKIRHLLGKPNLDSISLRFGWGPGATSAATGSRTTSYDKFKHKLEVTSNSLVMGHCCVNSTPSWINCQLQTDDFPSVPASLVREAFTVVRGNEIVFVPKNAKTDRVIAIEPHVNSYLQKGFGSHIRQRLLSIAGINLNDQKINQRLAKLGSLRGDLATVDLKGASDTISIELVRYLLPKDWFFLLDSTRSKQGFDTYDKQWLYYQKFSSMGNGYTFELESLIFWGLLSATLEVEKLQDVEYSVYGDDLIVPSAAYSKFANVLSFAGFTVNSSKSYSEGWFRESCGEDYFRGSSVRPVFLKKAVSNVEELCKLANNIRRYSHRRNFNYGCDHRFHRCWQNLVNRIPVVFRDLKIPEGFGDGGILSNFDEATPSRPGNGWQGFVYTALTRRPLKRPMRDRHAGYTATLSAIGSKEPLLGFVTPRSRTRPVATRCHTWDWYDLGPWA